jgi:hypothetical protein
MPTALLLLFPQCKVATASNFGNIPFFETLNKYYLRGVKHEKLTPLSQSFSAGSAIKLGILY